MNPKSLSCKALHDRLPDLIVDPATAIEPNVQAHLDGCTGCSRDYAALQQTMQLLDLWTVPEPSPYFDQKLAVLLREEQARPKLGWLERWRERLVLNTGAQFRPAMAGALALILLAGGGGVLHLAALNHATAHTSVSMTSATVNDLQVLDNNDQTIQQMGQLLDEDASNQSTAQPAS